MNKFILFIVIFSLTHMLTAQEFYNTKYDYVWTLGYQSDGNIQGFGGINIDFNFEPPLIEEVYRDLNFNFTNASICDSQGQLQFYTNAFHIGNPLNEIMDNGDTILLDNFNFDLANFEALRILQGALILPRPGSDHLYDLFHEEFNLDSNGELQVFNCFHSLIDMNENNGLGKVIEKSNILVKDTLDWGMLAATRHANGRDWWLIVPKYGTNVYFRFLVTPDGILPQEPQTFGTSSTYAGAGQRIFTPDGSKYISAKHGYGVSPWRVAISGFDRCSGLLTSEYLIQQSGIEYPSGAAVSPNSRFFYLLVAWDLWQYDLFESDIQGSKVRVAEWDGSVAPFSTAFGIARLGPDGRIYMTSGNGNTTLNIINHPNEKGRACDVIMNGIQLLNYNNSLPNFPNYRLGPIDGSSCDTLGIDNPLISESTDLHKDLNDVFLYPNPATDQIYFQFHNILNKNYNLLIYNSLGGNVVNALIEDTSNATNIATLPSGIYYYNLRCVDIDMNVHSGKFIKK